MKSTPAVSVRGGPAQARLIPNSLLTKPLPGGAQVVMETERALGRENPPSFFSHHSLFPPCALRRGLGTIQPLTDPPSPHKKSGREILFPIFFWWAGGGGGGHLYTGYTITIVYNVFRCGLMYHSTPNLQTQAGAYHLAATRTEQDWLGLVMRAPGPGSFITKIFHNSKSL